MLPHTAWYVYCSWVSGTITHFTGTRVIVDSNVQRNPLSTAELRIAFTFLFRPITLRVYRRYFGLTRLSGIGMRGSADY